MNYTKGVVRFRIILCISLIIGLSSVSLAQSTDQTYDVDACVSMDMSGLVRSQEITILSFDAKGIMRSNSESKVFDNCTVHSMGVSLFEGENQTVYCYMKYLGPEGDYVIFLYTVNPGEKAATTKLLAGTGKYKGITGGGKAVRIAGGKPVVEGTTQFCNNHKGSFTIPK
jgi:hypothetical protein